MVEGKVRFAIIGADFTLRALMAMWYPKDLGELAAICDWNPEMLAKFREDYGAEYPNVRLVRSFDEVLAMDDVDAVFVMVRDQYHEEMAVAALEAGKAVYLEKPMALSIEGCDRILEAAVRNEGRLFVGHNMRYVDSILKMKEVVDSGVIGQVQSVWVRHFVNYGSCYFRHWCGCQATCNGLLLQKGAHGGSAPKILRAFFEYVAHGVKPSVSPIAARNAVAVGAMGHYSARHGNIPMDIPPVPAHILQYFGEA